MRVNRIQVQLDLVRKVTSRISLSLSSLRASFLGRSARAVVPSRLVSYQLSNSRRENKGLFSQKVQQNPETDYNWAHSGRLFTLTCDQG